MPEICQSLTIARTTAVAAARLAFRAERQVVDHQRVPDVRLIVDADGPVLVEVVAGPRREIVFGPAERVVEVHVSPSSDRRFSAVSCSEW